MASNADSWARGRPNRPGRAGWFLTPAILIKMLLLTRTSDWTLPGAGATVCLIAHRLASAHVPGSTRTHPQWQQKTLTERGNTPRWPTRLARKRPLPNVP